MVNFAGFSKNREMRIDIIGDDKTGPATNSAKSNLDSLGPAAARIGMVVAAAAAAGAVGITKLVSVSIKAASDLQETQGKFDVVFKGQAERAEKIAKELADDYIMSENAAKSYLSTMQDMLKPMGMLAGEATELSGNVVKLAADLASFNNVPVEDTLRAIRSAMVGEFEPMRQFGTMLNVATIEAEALARGIIQTKDELTPLIKAQMAYTLALENNSDANGDAIRTSESYANQVKKLQAGIDDFTSTLGKELIPIASDYVKTLNEWVDANGELLAQDIGDYLSRTYDGISAVVGVLNDLPDGITSAALGGVIGRILTGSTPMGAAVGTIILLNAQLDKLGLGLGDIAQNSQDFGGYIQNMLDVLKGVRDANTGAFLDGRDAMFTGNRGADQFGGDAPSHGNVAGITEATTETLKDLTAKQLETLATANSDWQELELSKLEFKENLAAEMLLMAEEDAERYNELELSKLTYKEELAVREALEEEKRRAQALQLTQKHEAVVLSLKQGAVNNAVGLLNQLGQENEAAAIAAIVVQKAWAIAQTITSTLAAQMRAMAELGPIAGPPVAASIGAWGAVNVGLIAAQGLLQAASVHSGSSMSSVTQTAEQGDTFAKQQQAPIIEDIVEQPGPGTLVTVNDNRQYFQIEGNVVDLDELARLLITPTAQAIEDGVQPEL